MPTTPIVFTSLDALFTAMKRVADEHPDWTFIGADDPGTGPPIEGAPSPGPRIGWAAFPPGRSNQMVHWLIRLSDVRRQGDALSPDLREAIRTAQGRNTSLLEMVIGRPGTPEEPRPPRPSRYDLLMAEDD